MEAEILKGRLDALSQIQLQATARFIKSIEQSPRHKKPSGTFLGKPAWLEAFGLEIAGHHGVTHLPLMTEAFESAFANACRAVGWKVPAPGSMTQRFIDTIVTDGDGQEHLLSLKSTAAKAIREGVVEISKLTEAAYLQDMRSARTRKQKTVELISELRKTVESIVYLRSWRASESVRPHKYQLLEIPIRDLLEPLKNAPESAFNSDGPTIPLPYKSSTPKISVLLDRSDAKITLKKIPIDACILHGEWDLET